MQCRRRVGTCGERWKPTAFFISSLSNFCFGISCFVGGCYPLPHLYPKRSSAEGRNLDDTSPSPDYTGAFSACSTTMNVTRIQTVPRFVYSYFPIILPSFVAGWVMSTENRSKGKQVYTLEGSCSMVSLQRVCGGHKSNCVMLLHIPLPRLPYLLC